MGGCPGWSASSLGAHSLCWFCHEAGQLCLSQRYYFTRQQNLFISYTIDIPPYLVDKTSIYHCSKGCFSSSSAFLWLFVLSLFCSALRSPRYGKLCWLSACVSMFVVSRFIVASKDTMYVADADVTFCLTARELSRYTCTCSMQIKSLFGTGNCSLFGTGFYAILLYKEPCRTLLTAIF